MVFFGCARLWCNDFGATNRLRGSFCHVTQQIRTTVSVYRTCGGFDTGLVALSSPSYAALPHAYQAPCVQTYLHIYSYLSTFESRSDHKLCLIQYSWITILVSSQRHARNMHFGKTRTRCVGMAEKKQNIRWKWNDFKSTPLSPLILLYFSLRLFHKLRTTRSVNANFAAKLFKHTRPGASETILHGYQRQRMRAEYPC